MIRLKIHFISGIAILASLLTSCAKMSPAVLNSQGSSSGSSSGLSDVKTMDNPDQPAVANPTGEFGSKEGESAQTTPERKTVASLQQLKPSSPKGDNELLCQGNDCGKVAVFVCDKVLFGANLGQSVDCNTAQPPKLTLTPQNNLDWEFVVESPKASETDWSKDQPGKKIRFIFQADKASYARTQVCDLSLDSFSDPNTKAHRLTALLGSGDLVLYMDDASVTGRMDDDNRWVAMPWQDCSTGFRPVTGEPEYNASVDWHSAKLIAGFRLDGPVAQSTQEKATSRAYQQLP